MSLFCDPLFWNSRTLFDSIGNVNAAYWHFKVQYQHGFNQFDAKNAIRITVFNERVSVSHEEGILFANGWEIFFFATEVIV